MLFDPARHEPLTATAWDPALARATIARIVADACAQRTAQGLWLPHPRDLEPGEDPALPSATLYAGATGIVWALRRLRARGYGPAADDRPVDWDALRAQNRRWLRAVGSSGDAGYLTGELPILMLAWDERREPALLDELARLIESNADHPARELMWGAPGSMLAAWHLHRRSGDERFAALFRALAARLEEQLQWSAEHGCDYWTQAMYGRTSRYLDAVHGFVATALPLIRGRCLLADADWAAWQHCIVNTVERTATHEDGMANWRPWLETFEGKKTPMLMQYCHGAPGFVICLGDWPGAELDEPLLAAGRATWAAGPLAKGANLCHGTAGNGYAFLKLYLRTHDTVWLDRARAFAMHAIAQMQADASEHGRLRYSLWTGDPGLAIYLWDCLQAQARFPTLDVFYGSTPYP